MVTDYYNIFGEIQSQFLNGIFIDFYNALNGYNTISFSLIALSVLFPPLDFLNKTFKDKANKPT